MAHRVTRTFGFQERAMTDENRRSNYGSQFLQQSYEKRLAIISGQSFRQECLRVATVSDIQCSESEAIDQENVIKVGGNVSTAIGGEFQRRSQGVGRRHKFAVADLK